MEMDHQAYEKVKGLNIYMYKRMFMVKEWPRSLQIESWCMDRRRSGDCRMTKDSKFFQEYPRIETMRGTKVHKHI